MLLAGYDDGPDPARLDLAARVMTRLGPLEAAALYYSRAFVDEAKLDGPGEWSEFDRQPDDMPEPFELVLVHEGGRYRRPGSAVVRRAAWLAAVGVPSVPAVVADVAPQVRQ